MEKIEKISKTIKRSIRISRLSLLLLLLLCFNITVCPHKTAYCTEEQQESKERMSVSAFVFPSSGKLYTVRNIVLEFSDIGTGPSVNLTRLAFNDGFSVVKCEIIGQGKKCFLRFASNYSSTIGENKAVTYADIVCSEFLNAFDYKGLNNTYKSQNVIGTNIVITRDYGYMEYNTQIESSFLRYKPINGFGKFIDGLLTKYVITEDPDKGLIPAYTLKKSAYSSFSWDLEIDITMKETLSQDAKEYRIDLKELLNTSEPIVEIPHQQSSIVIYVQNRTISIDSNNKIVFNVISIQPDGYTIGPCEDYLKQFFDLKISYDSLNLPIENIDINISIKFLNSNWNVLVALMIITTITVSIVSFFVLKKKRRRR